MSGKQEQKKGATSSPNSEAMNDQEGAAGAVAEAGGPTDLQAAFDAASPDDRAKLFATLLDKYVDLSGQVDKLGGTIIELDLRGTEDAGACGVAELRLREMAEQLDQAERSASAHKGVQTRNAAELFGAISAVAAAVAGDLDLAPLDESESSQAHAVRLLGEIALNARAVAEERDRLKRQLAAQKGATTKARNEVVQLEEASRPRRLGPTKIPADSLPLTAAELLELIEDADQVELAFSNGRTELPGVPPVRLTGEPFVLRRGVLRLNVDSLQVTGPNTVKAPTSLAGFALLLDGEQVAWAPLSSPIALGAGQTYDLKDSVRFE